MFDFAAARSVMVESQIRTNDVTNLDVLKAFREVARENFVPSAKRALAYGDSHVSLDEERWVIRPRDHAKMVQAADIQPTDIVLDIGCGRGYSTAILAGLAETVIGLEDTDGRVEKATELLADTDMMNAVIVKGDLKGGAAEHGPFNVIFINGAVSDITPTWLDQLAHDGRLVCVVQEGRVGRCKVFTRSGDAIGERVIFDASLPPLPGFEREEAFSL